MLTNFKTQLIKKEQLVSDVFLFRFQLLEPKEINFKAGQYLMLKINDQRRLYSICSPDFIKNSFELMVEIIERGLGSTYFGNLKVGDHVCFQGSAGVFTIKQDDRDKIFLATGTGIAPIRSMIYKVQSSKLKVKSYLFWGLRTRKDLYFFDEFKEFSLIYPNFTFEVCLSREQNLDGLDSRYFSLGHINDGLSDFFSSKTKTPEVEERSGKTSGVNKQWITFDYYICGGRDVVVSMVEFLQKQGIKKENIFFEKF